MTVAVYKQKITGDKARIGRFTDDVLSQNFGKYFLDIVSHASGVSTNDHGVEHTKNKVEIEQWLAKHDFMLV